MHFDYAQYKQKGFGPLILLVVILVIAAVAGGAYYLGTRQKTLQQTVDEQNPVIWPSVTTEPNNKPSPDTSTLNTDETANWKTYRNLGIEFQYPSDFSLKEDTNNSTQNVADFTKSDEEFRKEFNLGRLVAPTENEAPYTKTDITKIVNGVTWKVVAPEQTVQYCDAGNCGKTAPSYYVYRNGYRYSFTYYSDDLRPTIDQILSTFKFIP